MYKLKDLYIIQFLFLSVLFIYLFVLRGEKVCLIVMKMLCI